MTETGRIVDLRTRAGFRADYAAIARRRLVAARQALNLTAAEFAEMLTQVVDWPVSTKAVEAWESTTAPPGDVLVAATTATAVDDQQFIGGVLGAVAPTFSAEALCGHWATCFQFGPGPDRKRHVDVAEVSLVSDRLVAIANSKPTPRSEGRASPFCNELEAQMANRHLVGHWKNSNDTRYFGTFHLAVLPGETVMEGYYTGFGSDVEVSTGPWKWVRLDADSIAEADLSTVRLRDPVDLGVRIEQHTRYHAPLTLADIEQGN